MQGVFPCAGDDEWLALRLADRADVERLADVAGECPGSWPRSPREPRDDDAHRSACSRRLTGRTTRTSSPPDSRPRGWRRSPCSRRPSSSRRPARRARRSSWTCGRRPSVAAPGSPLHGLADPVGPAPRFGEHTDAIVRLLRESADPTALTGSVTQPQNALVRISATYLDPGSTHALRLQRPAHRRDRRRRPAWARRCSTCSAESGATDVTVLDVKQPTGPHATFLAHRPGRPARGGSGGRGDRRPRRRAVQQRRGRRHAARRRRCSRSTCWRRSASPRRCCRGSPDGGAIVDHRVDRRVALAGRTCSHPRAARPRRLGRPLAWFDGRELGVDTYSFTKQVMQVWTMRYSKPRRRRVCA